MRGWIGRKSTGLNYPGAWRSPTTKLDGSKNIVTTATEGTVCVQLMEAAVFGVIGEQI
jgi:hypothetical protein